MEVQNLCMYVYVCMYVWNLLLTLPQANYGTHLSMYARGLGPEKIHHHHHYLCQPIKYIRFIRKKAMPLSTKSKPLQPPNILSSIRIHTQRYPRSKLHLYKFC